MTETEQPGYVPRETKSQTKLDKLAYLRKLMYGQWSVDDEKYVVQLKIIASLSRHHHASTLRVLIAYFHRWYTDKMNDDGEQGDDEFIEGMVERFLSLQSTKYLESLKDLVPYVNLSDKKTYIEAISTKICQSCMNKPNGQSYHDIVKDKLHLTAEMENMILNENMPEHWYDEWTYGALDDLFQGSYVTVLPDLIPDTLTEEALTDIIEAIFKDRRYF